MSVTADFTFEADGLEVQFTDATTGDEVIGREWRFGDAKTSEEQNPTHVYDWPGAYTVSLVSSPRFGLSGVAEHAVAVARVAPPARTQEESDALRLAAVSAEAASAAFERNPVDAVSKYTRRAVSAGLRASAEDEQLWALVALDLVAAASPALRPGLELSAIARKDGLVAS
jgi:hypothetical protein